MWRTPCNTGKDFWFPFCFHFACTLLTIHVLCLIRHVYRKWNERFFVEQMTAYTEGRVEKDPSQSWYDGEIGFFDFYIIPLAKKLKDCGVFGVSSHEYLDYAMKNREEWVLRGKEVVAEMMENFSAPPWELDLAWGSTRNTRNHFAHQNIRTIIQ